jgi:hypothetical protein
MKGGRYLRQGWALGLVGASLVAAGVTIFYRHSALDDELSLSVMNQVIQGITRQTPIDTLTKGDVRLSGVRIQKVGVEEWVDGTIEVRRRRFEVFRGTEVEPSGWFRAKFRSRGKTKPEEGFNAFGQRVTRRIWVSEKVELQPTKFWLDVETVWKLNQPALNMAFDGWLEGLKVEGPSALVATGEESLETKQIAWVLMARELRKSGQPDEARRALSRSGLVGRGMTDDWSMRAAEEKTMLDAEEEERGRKGKK